MNGCEAVRGLMANDVALIAWVPAECIVIGDLPQGSLLPAIAISSISVVDRNTLTKGLTKRVTERVQATVHSPNRAVQAVIQRLAKKAADARFPMVDGIAQVTVHSIGAGPDMTDQASGICIVPQDFRVSYNEL